MPTPTRQGNEPTTPGPPPPRTEYVVVNQGQQQQGGRIKGGMRWTAQRVADRGAPKLPAGIPSFLTSSRIISGAWVVAIGLVCYDEWHNGNILPRPARLWWTSILYGLLALAGWIIPGILPLANAFAIGYTVYLASSGAWKQVGTA
jgi:hypothetical protein